MGKRDLGSQRHLEQGLPMSLGPQVATSLTRYTVCVCSVTNDRRCKGRERKDVEIISVRACSKATTAASMAPPPRLCLNHIVGPCPQPASYNLRGTWTPALKLQVHLSEDPVLSKHLHSLPWAAGHKERPSLIQKGEGRPEISISVLMTSTISPFLSSTVRSMFSGGVRQRCVICV